MPPDADHTTEGLARCCVAVKMDNEFCLGQALQEAEEKVCALCVTYRSRGRRVMYAHLLSSTSATLTPRYYHRHHHHHRHLQQQQQQQQQRHPHQHHHHL